ncbi:MAG: thioredoxin family protein [Candidatus Izimaplasma sp.]|nr:thioredoxin family protein [Candidatus Izimaplasma bacterium]
MEIKVLGSGCPNCKRLEKNVKEALSNMNQNATIIKVTEMENIAAYGVMSTPALVVDEEVVFSGRVPTPKTLENYINKKEK